MQTLSSVPLIDLVGIPYFHDHYFSIKSSFQRDIALIKLMFPGIVCFGCLLIRNRHHFKRLNNPPERVSYRLKFLSNPSKGIITRFKSAATCKLRFTFSLFVANSEFETSALIWCFIKKKRCLSDNCESTYTYYFKEIQNIFYISKQ